MRNGKRLLQVPKQAVAPLMLVMVAIVGMGGYILLNNSHASTANPADINNDGVVNVFDLSLLLAAWTNTTPGATPTPTRSATPAPTVSKTPAPTTSPVSGGTTKSVEVTYYGAYDNDPSGSLAISNPVIHQQAGGTGTYKDPLTFASPSGTGAYPVGQIIYVPDVQKYFIKEDECAVSWTAPNGCGATSHVDLYVGNPSTSTAVVACEDSLTRSGNATIIVNPPSNLTYDPTPIWNQSTGQCMSLH